METEKRESRKNRDHICFSNPDFLPSFAPAFVLLDSIQHAEHHCPRYFLCQSVDDAGAPFERMLLVSLPTCFNQFHYWLGGNISPGLLVHLEIPRWKKVLRWVTIRKEKEKKENKKKERMNNNTKKKRKKKKAKFLLTALLNSLLSRALAGCFTLTSYQREVDV